MVVALGKAGDWGVAAAEFAGVFALARARGVPTLLTELPVDLPLTVTRDFEANRVGWMSMRWLVSSSDFSTFNQEHTAAGASWCPDYGVFPQDSTTCRDP